MYEIHDISWYLSQNINLIMLPQCHSKPLNFQSYKSRSENCGYEKLACH